MAVLSRIFSLLIVLFWLVMMGLLLRSDVFKRQFIALDLPPEHVLRLMFIHGQDSRLEILQEGETVGSFGLRPTRNQASQEKGNPYRLMFDGNLAVPSGENSPPIRLSVDGLIDFSEKLEMRMLRLVGGVRERKLDFAMEIDQPTEHLMFRIKQDDMVLREWEGKMRDLQHLPELTEAGVSSAQLEGLRTQVGTPLIRATKGSVSIKGNPVEAYEIIIQHAESIETIISFSQLGQVLKIKLFTGQEMLGEGVDP